MELLLGLRDWLREVWGFGLWRGLVGFSGGCTSASGPRLAFWSSGLGVSGLGVEGVEIEV